MPPFVGEAKRSSSHAVPSTPNLISCLQRVGESSLQGELKTVDNPGVELKLVQALGLSGKAFARVEASGADVGDDLPQ